MLGFLVDLFQDLLTTGTPEERRARKLRRKLVRYVRAAPASAFLGSGGAYVDSGGSPLAATRRRVLAAAKSVEARDVLEWEDLCARFLEKLEREMPGVVVQLPPDEPRLAYAGDKSL